MTGAPERQTSQRAQIWSRYWATGARHSCAGSFGDAYGGAIGDWWQQVFGELHADERVLDLATGSGAVLQLGLRHCSSQRVCWDGIDAGEVEPAWLQALPEAQARRVRIHPGVHAESLPFAAASFDLVTSQFGVEYSDLSQSITEVRRVLRPHGRLRCILHHADSQSLVLARVEFEHIQWLLAPEGLLSVVDQLCLPFSRTTTAQGREALGRDTRANQLRQVFNDLQDQRLQLAATSACPDVLHETSTAINQALALAVEQGAPAGEQALGRFGRLLRDSAFRLSDLIAHSLSPADLLGLKARLADLGFEVRTAEVIDGTRLMGWGLQAEVVN